MRTWTLRLAALFFAYLPTAHATPAERSCAAILSAAQNLLVSVKNAEADADVEALNAQVESLTEYFVGKGYDEYFASRHLVSLIYRGLQYDLVFFDKRSPEFKAYIEKTRPEDHRKFMAATKTSAGLFISELDEQKDIQFVIALNPDSEILPFQDAFFEEVLHSRFKAFTFRQAIRSETKPIPFLMTTEMHGLYSLIDELVAKESQRIFGRGEERDRSSVLGILMSYSDDSTEGHENFAIFLKTVAGCAKKAGQNWRELSLHKYLRCVLKISGHDSLRELTKLPSKDELTDILRAAYIENQKLKR